MRIIENVGHVRGGALYLCVMCMFDDMIQSARYRTDRCVATLRDRCVYVAFTTPRGDDDGNDHCLLVAQLKCYLLIIV